MESLNQLSIMVVIENFLLTGGLGFPMFQTMKDLGDKSLISDIFLYFPVTDFYLQVV